MIQYTPVNQLTIEEFKTPFEVTLSSENRWVKLAEIVNWDVFSQQYIKMMNQGFGRPGISPRIVLGALIIKHNEKLDDRGTIEAIQENPYMQYFLGLKGFSVDPVFDPSLFVKIRKRVGANLFDVLNKDLIASISSQEDKKYQSSNKTTPKNKGKMQADATVADQYIKYPTDSGLLNSARKESENMIDELYALKGKKGVKPKTYRRNLDKDFLNYSKKKRKSKSTHRKMNRKLLEALNRNIKQINKYLDDFDEIPLSLKQLRMLWIITTLYQQQKEMYDNKTKSCLHRIVSIYQPHVRPIPRGKTASQVEFGAKLGVSLDNGFARLNTFSWEAYSEGKDLIKQVEAYKELHGYYPDLVQVDKAYSTKANRKWLKERNIRITAPPLGRKPKEKENAYQKRKKKKEAAERNHIEAKFGQGKNGYRLNEIRARLKDTSESWISCIFFVMNLINYQKKVIYCAFFEMNQIYSNYWQNILINCYQNYNIQSPEIKI